jgi:hypothetical protein
MDTYAVKDGELVFDRRTGLVSDRIPLSDFLDELSGERAVTHRIRARILDVLPELMSDLEVPIYCRHRLKLEPNLWFSAPGTFSRLNPRTCLCRSWAGSKLCCLARSSRSSCIRTRRGRRSRNSAE